MRMHSKKSVGVNDHLVSAPLIGYETSLLNDEKRLQIYDELVSRCDLVVVVYSLGYNTTLHGKQSADQTTFLALLEETVPLLHFVLIKRDKFYSMPVVLLGLDFVEETKSMQASEKNFERVAEGKIGDTINERARIFFNFCGS